MSFREVETQAGKITIAALLCVLSFSVLAFLFSNGAPGHIQEAQADFATTTVTVLNIAPNWTVNAAELYASATSTPTNVGTSTVWVGTATDGNAEDYFLLICTTAGAPTPNEGAPPECNGGSGNRLARSATTTSGTEATASRTALYADAEAVYWFAWVCDANTGNAACNATSTGHGGAATGSPFIVNHPVNFYSATNTADVLPDTDATWYTISSDEDTLRADTFELHVCKAADFTGTACGGGGFFSSSTLYLENAEASTTIEIPTHDVRDGDYSSYVYLVDEFGLLGSGTPQGSDVTLTIANATPTIAASSIDLGSSSPLQLNVEGGETTGLLVNFTVTDANSCISSTSSDEIIDARLNVYRSGVGSSSCQVGGDYDPNHCYPDAVGATTWNYSCSQVAGTCAGATDTAVDWTCTFPLWFVADPTEDGSSYHGAENWLATVAAVDNNSYVGDLSEDDDGTELDEFLSFSATGSPIAYGSLEPGQDTGTLFATTTLYVTGNTGLDELLSGADMCITYPTCSTNSTSTIYATSSEYALSAVNIGLGTTLTGTPVELEINIASTTGTTSASYSGGDTYWGISVPSLITVAGDYVGVNTITGVVAEVADW